MNVFRFDRLVRLMVPAAILYQAGGCDFAQFNEVLQTILLGITAAGAIAIIRNI